MVARLRVHPPRRQPEVLVVTWGFLLGMVVWIGTVWASFGGWLVLAGVTMLAAAWGLMSATAHTRMATAANAMLVMLIGGLWHGAHVNFVTWGAINGAALVAWIVCSPPPTPLGVVRWVGCSRFMWWSSAAFGFALEAWCFGHQTTRRRRLRAPGTPPLAMWANLTSPTLSTMDLHGGRHTWAALGLMVWGTSSTSCPIQPGHPGRRSFKNGPCGRVGDFGWRAPSSRFGVKQGASRPFIYWQF